ncbi:hypothetical protein ACXYTJ_06160 [Gilvimarinus sp. F26214L]|uniref:hypothetical protein n=1 Tax=Gilvimarinus sp. DZF01 TaxID=3461371 RepID=UPI00404683D1
MEGLNNLVKAKQLRPEPPDQREIEGMIRAAETKLKDAAIPNLSTDSQFSLAYAAAHSLGLAALRSYGYRAENRYIVFQSLQHTLGWESARWRVLDQCHKRRNIAEYEGHLEIEEQLLAELIATARIMLAEVKALTGR